LRIALDTCSAVVDGPLAGGPSPVDITLMLQQRRDTLGPPGN
jgi:hypothetical protein